MLIQTFYYVFYTAVGSMLGLLYGFLFMLQKRGTLSVLLPTDDIRKAKLLRSVVASNTFWTILRLSLFAAIWYYLLPLSTVHFILIVVSFLFFRVRI